MISVLAEKGVTIANDSTFSDAIMAIRNINTGKCKFGSSTVTSNINSGWTITGIGFKPNLVGIIAWVGDNSISIISTNLNGGLKCMDGRTSYFPSVTFGEGSFRIAGKCSYYDWTNASIAYLAVKI